LKSNIKAIAGNAGVSVTTVSRVINGSVNVSPETRSKVNEACALLNYRPSAIARGLRTNKTNTIGVLLPIYWENDYIANIINGIRGVLQNEGYYLLLGSTDNSQENELAHIDNMHIHHVDGLIIIPNNSESEYLAPTHGTGAPTVFMDRRVKGDYGDCVMCDSFTGTYDAIKVLIEKGHKKIGIISGTLNVSPVFDRIRGYKHALLEAGIPIDENLVLSAESARGDLSVGMLRELMEEQGVTAVFFADCVHGFRCVDYIIENSIRIPQDLAVICFDDYPVFSSRTPKISAVIQPMFEMGSKAAQLIVDRIANPGKAFETCYLPAMLMIRESI